MEKNRATVTNRLSGEIERLHLDLRKGSVRRNKDFLTPDSANMPRQFPGFLTVPRLLLAYHEVSKTLSCQSILAALTGCHPMIPYLSERENVVEHINSICIRLFDTWCECRSVTPLGYLLHSWPLMDSEPTSIRRLGETLRELRKTHFDAIGTEAMRALLELADLVDELLQHASVEERGVANG